MEPRGGRHPRLGPGPPGSPDPPEREPVGPAASSWLSPAGTSRRPQVDREAGRSTRVPLCPAMRGRTRTRVRPVCEEAGAASGRCATFKQGSLSHGYLSAQD